MKSGLSKTTNLKEKFGFMEGGMEISQLQRHFVEQVSSMFSKGYLDGQFFQLQKLQGDGGIDFYVELVSVFFQDSEKLINEMGIALDKQPVDFKEIGANAHQLKGSSASMGAKRVSKVCEAFCSLCKEMDKEGCLRCFDQLKHEFPFLKGKVEALLRLVQKIVASGGAVPVVEP
ncbi:Histidine-containing phosphotransfer protein 1 [Acorus calamus]|uniref:Histidine-containing phosphotransfer protein n=1 Tax=Acorus calamus TaxID=4465 RepID=A0AAV9ETH7_ACOCL|nr:Histidine-containing phosphotransfer protein 1 [Acorus calamus]